MGKKFIAGDRVEYIYKQPTNRPKATIIRIESPLKVQNYITIEYDDPDNEFWFPCCVWPRNIKRIVEKNITTRVSGAPGRPLE